MKVKSSRKLLQVCLLWVLLLPAGVEAQLTFTTNNGVITIAHYTGSGGTVVIPSTTNGYPVTTIGSYAFQNCNTLTNVDIASDTNLTTIGSYAFQQCTNLSNFTVGNSVTNIQNQAFFGCLNMTNIAIGKSVTSIGFSCAEFCYSLTTITVDTNNAAYSSLGGVLFDKLQTVLIQFPEGISGGYTIPNSVTSIGASAFFHCSGLTNVAIVNCINLASIGANAFLNCYSLTTVTIANCPNLTSLMNSAFNNCASLTSISIPKSVTFIGANAFSYCYSLKSIYFNGDVPTSYSGNMFSQDPGIVYYLPGTTGWGFTLAGLPTAPWTPQVQMDASFGVQTNQFGFNISWASDMVVVVEACTDLLNSVWFPVQTNTLTGGTSYFIDSQWTNYSRRYYRLRSP